MQPKQHRRRYSRRVGGALLAALGLATGAAVMGTIPPANALAQDAAASSRLSIGIFQGDLAENANVKLGSWGSGRAEQSKENIFVGDSSIRLTTQGFYQGGRLDFTNPVDLGSAFGNPNAYVRLRVRFSGASGAQNSFDPGSGETARRAASPFERMRFLLTMADGTTYELIRPVSIAPTDDPDAYVPITFPVSALVKKGADGKPGPVPSGDGAKVKQMAVFGDRYAVFNLGEIGVITDETEFSVQPLDLPPVFVNDTISFIGSAEGGATTLRYTWDFDASDGIQADSEGRVITHVFKKAGKFTVTLTVTDVDGIKKPVTTTSEVEVTA
ncbi:MAG: PKD domain-containing protein [Cytophagales bacterium]|nr:PKD domain-containing protein [Armatimonadota bacterium]